MTWWCGSVYVVGVGSVQFSLEIQYQHQDQVDDQRIGKERERMYTAKKSKSKPEVIYLSIRRKSGTNNKNFGENVS